MNSEVKKAMDILIRQAKIEIFKQCLADFNNTDISNEVLEIVENSLLEILTD